MSCPGEMAPAAKILPAVQTLSHSPSCRKGCGDGHRPIEAFEMYLSCDTAVSVLSLCPKELIRGRGKFEHQGVHHSVFYMGLLMNSVFSIERRDKGEVSMWWNVSLPLKFCPEKFLIVWLNAY